MPRKPRKEENEEAPMPGEEKEEKKEAKIKTKPKKGKAHPKNEEIAPLNKLKSEQLELVQPIQADIQEEQEKPNRKPRKNQKAEPIYMEDQKKRRNKKNKEEEQEDETEIFSQVDSVVESDEQEIEEKEASNVECGIANTISEHKAVQTELPTKSKKKTAKKKVKAKVPYKLGKWNTNIVPNHTNKVWEEEGPFQDYDDLESNNRNMHRAVNTNNQELYKKCIMDKTILCSVHDQWGPELQTTPLELCISQSRTDLLSILFSKEGKEAMANRVVRKNNLLKYIGSGNVGNAAFGRRVRRVNMTRGNRQGNNAFLEKDILLHYANDRRIFSRIMSNPSTKFELLQKIFLLNPEIANSFTTLIYKAVRKGNRELAGKMITPIKDQSNYGLCELHQNVCLFDGQDLPTYHKATAHKKAVDNMGITPLHCACINPNPKYLSELIKAVDGEINILDNSQAKLIHYAAVCAGSEPLKLLLSKGANLNDIDNRKRNPLFYAVKAGRAENCKIILEAMPNLIKSKNKKNHQPIQYAAKFGNIEVIQILKEFKSKLSQKIGYWGMAPIHLAAAYNHYDLAEWIIENKGKINVKDKYGRTPLIMAARNGNIKIVNMLLQKGAPWDEADKSKNTPLHFAVAYGWDEVIEELLKAGANPNALNAWKISPLNLALLMGRNKILKRLLTIHNIDVNVKDEKGRTLLSLAMELYNPKSLNYLEYLLKEKKANPDIQDEEGLTPLHWLINNTYEICEEINVKIEENEKKKMLEDRKKYKKDILMLLLKYKANPSLISKKGESVVSACLKCKEYELMQYFLEVVSFNNTPELCYSFTQIIYNPIVRNFFVQIYNSDPISSEKLNTYMDKKGFPIFLIFLQNYVENAKINYEKVRDYATYRYKQIKFQKSKKQIKINDLCITYANLESDEKQEMAFPESLDQKDTLLISQYSDEAYDSIYTAAILSVMKLFIEGKADPNVTVGKLSKYRITAEARAALLAKYKKHADQNSDEEESANESDNQQFKEDFEQSDIEELSEVENEIKPKIEYCEFGLCNAYHISMLSPNPLILNYLDSIGTKADTQNYMGHSPLRILVDKKPNYFEETAKRLNQLGVDIDSKDFQKATPLLAASEHQDYTAIKLLLDFEAYINVEDTKSNFPLKYSVTQGSLLIAGELLKRGANVMQVDHNKRTALHFAVNGADPNADAQSDMENLLLRHGADINAKDIRMRTPLHYCFVKIGKPFENSFIDPIETVSNLCAHSTISIDPKDQWGKTPLHYASQRGAVISALFLLGRSACLDEMDIYKNTPLSVAMLNGHSNYAISLIEKGANVINMVHPEPYRLEKQENDGQIKKKSKSNDINDSENSDDDIKLIFRKIKQEDIIPIKARRKVVARNQFNLGIFANKLESAQPVVQKDQIIQACRTIKQEISMFRIAIMMEWQGLIYLLIDKKYDYMMGMEDALIENKYKLVMNLLRKTPNDSTVQKLNNKSQNLLHILGEHGAKATEEQFNQLYSTFKERGVKDKLLDINKRTALEYAVESRNVIMAAQLIKDEYNPNAYDSAKETAVILAIKGNNVKTAEKMLSKIVEGAKINANVLYKEKYYEELKKEMLPKKERDAKKYKEYSTTPLIHAVRYYLLHKKANQNIIDILLQNGANAEMEDTEGRTPIFYAAIFNNMKLVEKLIPLVKSKQKQDIYKKTVLHYAILANDVYTFNNKDMIALLLKSNFPVNVSDCNGETPLSMASKLYSPIIANVFSSYGFSVPDDHKHYANSTEIEVAYNIPYTEDAEKYVNEIQSKISMPKKKIRPDKTGSFGKSYEIVNDCENGPYDVNMTKVNLKNGLYGEYLFYKMQLLFESNREIYVVFTRWGRIGEYGAHQFTPFDALELAKAEFCKIFKSKNGNSWEEHSLLKMPKKYVLLAKKQDAIEYKDILAELDYLPITITTALPKPLYKLMKVIGNTSLYSQAMNTLGFNQSQLPLCNLSKQVIQEAKQTLTSLKSTIEDYENERKLGMKADTSKMQVLINTIYDQSSRYYELLPHDDFNDTMPTPIQTSQQLHNELAKVEDLLNIEKASKMLLASKYNEQKTNPLEYLYKCLDICMDRLLPDSDEYQLLLNYITGTLENCKIKIKNIFKLSRYGETRQCSKSATLKNKLMLFHGTKTYNYLSILGGGLKIAPFGAQITGWAFGKGLYFADMFAKSINYCASASQYQSFSGKNRKKQMSKYKDQLMLINQVALGNQHLLLNNIGFDGQLPLGFDSLKALGLRGPDFEKSVILTNGSELPQGDAVYYKIDEKIKNSMSLSYNEYIAFDESQAKMQYLIQFEQM